MMDNPQVLFYGKVKDNQDPQKIGRIRALPTPSDINNLYKIPPELLNDSGTDIRSEYWWQREDPFVFLPLLPFFINVRPKPNEFVHLMYSNKEYPLQNKFYISGVLSTPTAVRFQNYNDSTTYLSDGTNVAPHREIITELNDNTKTDSYGIFPQPEDNAVLGRGSTDLILKENTVLLRAGKSEINNGQIPIANNNRAFLELDYFPSNTTKGNTEKKIVQTVNVALVKFLVEYQIYNPENNYNMFSGNISIFRLKPNIATNTSNLNQESDIEQYKIPPLYRIDFFNRSKSELINLIDEFINGVNSSFINIEPYPVKPLETPFPFYFRMSKINYSQIISESSTSIVKNNLSDIIEQVNPFENSNSKGITGFGLVSEKGKIGNTFNYKIEEYNTLNFSDRPKTYGLLGGDELYLISHESEIPGKQKIKIDKSLYGYTQEQISTIIKENTEGMVRGGQLINFLNMIVNFLVNHVHPIPGSPPVPVAMDGTTTAEILKTINDAPIKMLNENIRIN
jgi:hypothetical protein